MAYSICLTGEVLRHARWKAWHFMGAHVLWELAVIAAAAVVGAITGGHGWVVVVERGLVGGLLGLGGTIGLVFLFYVIRTAVSKDPFLPRGFKLKNQSTLDENSSRLFFEIYVPIQGARLCFECDTPLFDSCEFWLQERGDEDPHKVAGFSEKNSCSLIIGSQNKTPYSLMVKLVGKHPPRLFRVVREEFHHDVHQWKRLEQ